MIQLFRFFFPDLSLWPRGLRLLTADDWVLERPRERGQWSKASRTDKIDDRVKFFEVVLKRRSCNKKI